MHPSIKNGGEVYRSNDSGRTYTRYSTGANYLAGSTGSIFGWYTNIIWSNPNDPDNLVVGGVNLWRGTIDFSTGTLTLTQISNGGANSAHADHHVIVEHPGFNNTSNKIAFFGNDGGIHRADDVAAAVPSGGTSIPFVELNNTIGITQFYGAAGNAATGVIVGGTQDNGTLRYTNNTEGWTQMFGNDGGYCAADPTDSNYFYGESQNLNVIRSSNGGVSASAIVSGLGDANIAANTNFIAPIVLDPNDPNILLAGGISLWRSIDVKAATPTWTAVKNPTVGNSPISAIAVSPSTSNIIFVGHNSGAIFRAFNPSPSSWAQIDTAGVPNRFVTRLLIDNTRSPNWIYATFGGFSPDNVYRSTDNGNTWADITGIG